MFGRHLLTAGGLPTQGGTMSSMLMRRALVTVLAVCSGPVLIPAAAGASAKPGTKLYAKQHPKRKAGKARAHMAVGGYQVYGTGGQNLNERSGPGTGYSRVGQLANGTPIDIQCQVRSDSSIGGSTIWDFLSDGRWVTDYYVSTPNYNNFSPPIPQCGQASREDNAVNFARSQLGSGNWNGWCDRFVANAFGRSSSGYYSAWDHWNDLVNRGLAHPGDTNVPYGALAFWGPVSGNQYGHVGIGVGGGQVISATYNGVRQTDLGVAGNYQGWAWANPEWAGR
jgi:hypothetical protein